MSPKKIFLFLVSVIVGIGLLMLIFPENGIKISDDLTLQFVTWDEFLHPVEHKDISYILENNAVEEDTIEIVEIEKTLLDSVKIDSAYIDSTLIVYTPIPINIDSTLQRIDFPKNNDTLLDNFFKNLTELRASGEAIHVLHYGDSQIEVDRMTGYIRCKLQSAFGGYGAGFHSGIQAYDFRLPMIVSYSEGWHRYKIFPHKDSCITHRRFGITTNFSMFKDLEDTTQVDVEATEWIEFQKPTVGYSNTKKYSKVRLFYGYNTTDVSVKVYADEQLVETNVLPSGEGLRIKTWNFATAPNKLKFEYTGKSSPEIYGYSFDSNSGVMVDNLSVRGSGGLFFGRMDFSLASQIYKAMNVKFILMQFGGNAISNDSASVAKYAQYLGNQIKYLKNVASQAPIILIGPADMSEKDKETYVTRPVLPYLVEQMKKIALKNDCAFWNMYEAMGGQNSMPSWVFHEPALAEKDFIHFSPKGAKIIAQMFYKSLIVEYNKFAEKQQKKK